MRGDIIPIIDSKKRFGVGLPDSPPPTRILVDPKGRYYCRVSCGFERLRSSDVKRKIQSAPGKVVGADTEYIWGVTKRSPDSHLIMLFDVERILKIEDEGVVRADAAPLT